MSKAQWLKLSVNIMQDEKIRLIRRLEYGDSYFALWIGLLCFAMRRESPALYVAEGVPVSMEELAHLYGLDILRVSDGLAIFAKYGMIAYDSSGAIIIAKFAQYQALDEMERKREMVAERVRKHRVTRNTDASVTCNADVTVTGVTCNAIEEEVEEEKEVEEEYKNLAAKESPPEVPHATCSTKKPQKNTVPGDAFVSIEEAWDAAYKAESGADYVRNYGRDRKVLAPLIQSVGAEEVCRRVGMFFTLPAQYWARTVVNFAARFNAIPAAAAGKSTGGKYARETLDLSGAMIGSGK